MSDKDDIEMLIDETRELRAEIEGLKIQQESTTKQLETQNKSVDQRLDEAIKGLSMAPERQTEELNKGKASPTETLKLFGQKQRLKTETLTLVKQILQGNHFRMNSSIDTVEDTAPIEMEIRGYQLKKLILLFIELDALEA